jgi:hypothetical protein
MRDSERVAVYRLHAAQCIGIAHRSADLKNRLTLLDMAQSWLALADQAMRNSETVLVRESSLFGGATPDEALDGE